MGASCMRFSVVKEHFGEQMSRHDSQ
jgi:hypothetical protein